MKTFIVNAPLIITAMMVLTLLVIPNIGLARCAIVSALLSLTCNPEAIPDIMKLASNHIFTVLVIMSATTLPVHFLLDDGLGDVAAKWIAWVCKQRLFYRIPSSVVLPILLLPLTMVAAMIIHNIPAIAVFVPFAIILARSFYAPIPPLICGMLVASNLGGASFAAGDTPAIMQRKVFGFDVATFSSAMVPRNIVVLLVLILVVAVWSWWRNRDQINVPSYMEIYERLRLYDYWKSKADAIQGKRVMRLVSILSIIAIVISQFYSNTATLQVSLLILIVTILTSRQFIQQTFVLGYETWIAIMGLFTLSAAVEKTPLMNELATRFISGTGGGVELAAFFVTAAISADGAAALLTELVHAQAHGAYSAAWSLAGGICAGSSMLLSSASAGPILIESAQRSGVNIPYITYALFGIPFSILMICIYLLLA